MMNLLEGIGRGHEMIASCPCNGLPHDTSYVGNESTAVPPEWIRTSSGRNGCGAKGLSDGAENRMAKLASVHSSGQMPGEIEVSPPDAIHSVAPARR